MNNIFKIAVNLFDSHSPKILVDIRIKIFRYVRNLFYPQRIHSDQIINFSENNKHVFFGYYDIIPFDKKDKKLLAMRVPLISRAPQIKDFAEVGYYNLEDPERGFAKIGKTNTWCWQQGCRLQWYARRDDQIIYNCLIDGKYGAVIKEVPSGKTIKKINKPLYSVSNDGKWGLSLDFSRLQRLRPGYGYGVLPDETINILKPDYNGIELVDLETNKVKQLFTLEEVSKIEPHSSMEGAEHYFNHIMFNSSGNKFIFFHLWMSKFGKRYSRLFVADRDGSNPKLLNNSGCVSHYNWISNNKLILYSLVEQTNKLMYAIFNSITGEIKYFGKNIPKVDGHPALLKKEKIIITDTYPDIFSQRNLLYYDIKKDKTIVLARFNDPKDLTGELRCDLHPRVNNRKNKICVDRIFKGKRCISLIPFNDVNL
jgi:hypothetical protein